MKDMFKDIKVEEMLKCFMLIIVGYFIAKLFSKTCNGFNVGGECESFDGAPCMTGGVTGGGMYSYYTALQKDSYSWCRDWDNNPKKCEKYNKFCEYDNFGDDECIPSWPPPHTNTPKISKFDLSVLNLNPTNGSVIYENQNNGWRNISNGNKSNGNNPQLTHAQLVLLNSLQEKLELRYIGVNNKGVLGFKYRILAGIQSGKPGADFTFSGPDVDEETLSIDLTSVLIHDTNYNANNPTITNVTVTQYP